MFITLNAFVVVAQSSSPNLDSIVSSVFSNPFSLAIFAIQFALGVGLGYFTLKVIKYIVALIAIFIVGAVLNIWAAANFGTTIHQQLSSLGLEWSKIYPVFLSIIYALGLTTILPITIGFIIGIVIALAKGR